MDIYNKNVTLPDFVCTYNCDQIGERVICVIMYVCMYVYLYVCTNACMHDYVNLYMYECCAYACMSVY